LGLFSNRESGLSSLASAITVKPPNRKFQTCESGNQNRLRSYFRIRLWLVGFFCGKLGRR
jgi:hypothetical protein